MPYKCCVPGCRGNFTNGPKVKVFSFPKEADLKAEWLDSIKKKNFVPSKHSRVCELHFFESDILKESSMVDSKTGKIVSAPLCHPKLNKIAIPSIFPVLSNTPRKVMSNNKRKKKNSGDSTKEKKQVPSTSQDSNSVIDDDNKSNELKEIGNELNDDKIDTFNKQQTLFSYANNPEDDMMSASHAFLVAIEALEKRTHNLEEELKKLSSAVS